MTLQRASLIIVSRHRPAALMRAMAAVVQMDHPEFELIVVTDPSSAKAVRALGLPMKLAEFDRANISAARNIGLEMASAPIVAFLDDDATPEPTWLSRLVAPFADPQVTAATGFVLGRSGLAWQWRAAWVDGDGFDHAFRPPAGVSLFPGTAIRAIKTQGTNCAFRRDDLLAIGGFDECFAFYLDEADVNLRLAGLGAVTAIVPEAVVHHGFAASARRRGDRTPTDLTDIGQSLAFFAARHGLTSGALDKHVADQRSRLIRHMISGKLEPGAVKTLMSGLFRGIRLASNLSRDQTPRPLVATGQAFAPLPETGPRAGCLLFGSNSQRAALEEEARAARARGEIVTLILLSRGMRPHRHSFTENGWWEQSGGRFGRAFRTKSRFNWKTAAERQTQEAARLSRLRPIFDKS